MIQVFIENDNVFFNEIHYIWDLYCRDQNIEWRLADNFTHVDLSIGIDPECQITINKSFFESLRTGNPCNSLFIEGNGFFLDGNGKEDYLTSAFYMVSCAQEINSKDKDRFNRSPYEASFQAKLKLGTIDLVSDCFNKLTLSNPLLTRIAKKVKQQSTIFLSHDIDLLYGSLMQDSFYCFKKMDLLGLSKVIYKNIFDKPMWMNIDRILQLEKKFGYSSTFFWLPVSGSSHFGVKNADYNIRSNRIQALLDLVEVGGGVNGIHKSISKFGFREEIGWIGRSVKANRFHFLATDPQSDLLKMENAGIKFDSSISFAERPCFRNGYSKPYKPYLFKERRPAAIIECPMHLMDTTFYNYLKMNAEDAYSVIISFIEAHPYNSTLSILWHNNYISDYKYRDYGRLYERILLYLSEKGFKSVSPIDIIQEFKI